jgi:serine/threonine protein kinase
MALKYLHSRDPPVIHGDLHGVCVRHLKQDEKTDMSAQQKNVLVDDNGHARLCDFGLTRLKYEMTSKPITDVPPGGALRYLAPELSAGPSIFRTTQATDIYSFSMTMFQLGTLSEPFHEKSSLAAAIAAQKGERPEMPSSLWGLPDIATRALWVLLESMWAHDPAERVLAGKVSTRLRELRTL